MNFTFKSLAFSLAFVLPMQMQGMSYVKGLGEYCTKKNAGIATGLVAAGVGAKYAYNWYTTKPTLNDYQNALNIHDYDKALKISAQLDLSALSNKELLALSKTSNNIKLLLKQQDQKKTAQVTAKVETKPEVNQNTRLAEEIKQVQDKIATNNARRLVLVNDVLPWAKYHESQADTDAANKEIAQIDAENKDLSKKIADLKEEVQSSTLLDIVSSPYVIAPVVLVALDSIYNGGKPEYTIKGAQVAYEKGKNAAVYAYSKGSDCVSWLWNKVSNFRSQPDVAHFGDKELGNVSETISTELAEKLTQEREQLRTMLGNFGINATQVGLGSFDIKESAVIKKATDKILKDASQEPSVLKQVAEFINPTQVGLESQREVAQMIKDELRAGHTLK